MLSNCLSALISLLLAAQASLATARALFGDPPCLMILVVEKGVITAFDCQDEPTECEDLSEGTACTKITAGTAELTTYHCNCCDKAGCIGSTNNGYCLPEIVVAEGEAPDLRCNDVLRCDETMSCPKDPPPMTGAAECPCK